MKNKVTPLDALLFAANKTSGFYTKSSRKPYVDHLIEVANILSLAPMEDNEELLVTGILSDLLENSDTSEEEIQGVFGNHVLGKLKSLTDNESTSAKDMMHKREQRVFNFTCDAKLIEIARCIAQIDEIPEQWTVHRRLEYLNHLERVVKNCGVNLRGFADSFAFKLFNARNRIIDEHSRCNTLSCRLV